MLGLKLNRVSKRANGVIMNISEVTTIIKEADS